MITEANIVKIANMNVNKSIVNAIKTKEVSEFIVFLNTDVQLNDEGVNSLGVRLSSIGGNYAPSTARKKRRNPGDVNLKDTGKFYDSFSVIVQPNGDFVINSQPIKNGVSLFNRWGDKVEGLTKENAQLVFERIEELIIHELLE